MVESYGFSLFQMHRSFYIYSFSLQYWHQLIWSFSHGLLDHMNLTKKSAHLGFGAEYGHLMRFWGVYLGKDCIWKLDSKRCRQVPLFLTISRICKVQILRPHHLNQNLIKYTWSIDYWQLLANLAGTVSGSGKITSRQWVGIGEPRGSSNKPFKRKRLKIQDEMGWFLKR